MRLRIQTLSPLPELKAWFIPEIQDADETVFYLKELLCTGIPQLKADQTHAQDLVLFLEGFELLNDSPISAVRDGDLIVVRRAHHMMGDTSQPPHSRKRKRNSNDFDRSPKRRSTPSNTIRQVFSTHRKVSDASELDEGRSSDSESTASDSSTTSPILPEASASSSESSPTILPVKDVSQARKPQLGKEPVKQPSKTAHVPPGKGKASTHSRNNRRKKRRESERLAKAGLPNQPKGISEANQLPLGCGRAQNVIDSSSASLPQPSNETNVASLSTQDTTSIPYEGNSVDREPSAPSLLSKHVYITTDQVMMGSLRNKNKKKGFKQSMAGPILRKVVFSDLAGQDQLDESNPGLDDHAPHNSVGHQFSEATTSTHRLIPPSELQDLGQLPSNVIVTSVDVEEHIWGASDNLPKKKQGKKRKRERQSYDDGEYGFEDGRDQGNDQAYIEEFLNGDGETTLVTSNDLDWDKAGRLWETWSPVQRMQQLTDGVIVGWKELALHPRTFTPEMLLFLARVIRIHEGTDDTDVKIHFRRQLRRSEASEAAVAFGVAPDGEDGEEEEASWSDALKGQWKIVDI